MSLAARRISAGHRQCPDVGPELRRLEALPLGRRGAVLARHALPRPERARRRALQRARRRRRWWSPATSSSIRRRWQPRRRRSRRSGRRSAARPVWLAASTHPGEEEIVAEAHRLLAAGASRATHRHRAAPSRARARDCRGARGARPEGGAPEGRRSRFRRRSEIYVADTLGELGLFYRAAPGRLHRRLAGHAWRAEPDRADQPRRRRAPRAPCPQLRRRLCGARRRCPAPAPVDDAAALAAGGRRAPCRSGASRAARRRRRRRR